MSCFIQRAAKRDLSQPLGDRARDAGEVVDFSRVEPYAQPGLAERLGDLLGAVAIGPSVADENVVGGGHVGTSQVYTTLPDVYRQKDNFVECWRLVKLRPE